VGVQVPPPPILLEDAKVFTFRGKPLKDIRTAFENARNRAGIKNLTFHTLRHTFATRLVLSGVDLATVSKLLGHSTIQMTMRYSHPTPEALKNAVSKLDK
jgi:integrase